MAKFDVRIKGGRTTYQVGGDVLTERTITYKHRPEDGPFTLREKWGIRSDGLVLTRTVWSRQDSTGEVDRRHGQQWTETQWRFKNPDNITVDRLIAHLTGKCKMRVVTAAELAAERKDAAARAKDTRDKRRGPTMEHGAILDLYRRAHEAGDAAALAVQPTGMEVIQRANPLDDSSPVVRVDTVRAGVCGYAYVKIRPADSDFGKWAAGRGWYNAYGGGLEMSVHGYGQSVERKAAYARAFAAVLSEAGITAFGYSRVD